MFRNIVLSVLSILMTLLLLEIGTRFYYGSSDRIPPHADAGVRDEWRWADEHLRAGKPVVEGLSGYDPLLGWREPGELTDWIRRKGWNVPPDPLQDGLPHRTVFIGDSFTAGLHVEPREAFAAVFGSAFHPTEETFNLGVSGYGLDQMLLLYELEGPRLHADTVVLGLYLGGVDRALSGFTYYAKPRLQLRPDGQLTVSGQPVPAPQQLYDAYVNGDRQIGNTSSSLLWSASATAWTRWQSRHRFQEQSPDLDLLKALLVRFNKAAQALQDKLIILMIPTRLEEFTGSAEAHLQSQLLRFLCDRSIRAIRLDAALAAIEQSRPERPLYRPRDAGGHFSAAGHHATAAILAASLRGKSEEQCRPDSSSELSRAP